MMLFKEKEKHPWSCDMSKGDVQCPFVTPNGDGYLNCTWKIGHPLGLLQHEVVHDQPTPPPNRKWFNFQGGETKDDKPYTMNDLKVVVPEGMARAYQSALSRDASTFAPLEAALLWLSENPRIPTPEELDPLCLRYSWLDRDSVRFGTREWQRRMFLAPDEPAVPGGIEDLMAGIEDMPVTEREWAKKVVVEAYRRGRSDSFPG